MSVTREAAVPAEPSATASRPTRFSSTAAIA